MMRVATYLRRSSDSATQEDSIDRQRTECRKFAEAQGWVITNEYLDDAISGVNTLDRRAGFAKAVTDAGSNVYDVLLGFSMSRFGRSDAFESIAEILPLKRSGVRLATVESGLIDWENFTDFLTLSIQKNSDHEYSKALGHNVSSGLSRRFAAGLWHGSPPRGFQIGLGESVTFAETFDGVFSVLNGLVSGGEYGDQDVVAGVTGTHSVIRSRWVAVGVIVGGVEFKPCGEERVEQLFGEVHEGKVNGRCFGILKTGYFHEHW